MPWEYIRNAIGPGLHWGKSQKVLLEAIDRAHTDGKHDAAEHLRIILAQRNAVMNEKEAAPPHGSAA